MSLSSVKRGFTLIELLVVIAIIAILASILFPVFAKAREKARQTQCTSNVKQLTTALQIYVQENQGKYPGSQWLASTTNTDGIDASSSKVLICPDDTSVASPTVVAASQISYGYNGLLVKVDGRGVTESMIIAPTRVGAFADVAYGKTVGTPGLIGGSAIALANSTGQTTDIAYRHAGGTICGYVDGHAKFTLTAPNALNISNEINQGFTSAPGLGLLDYNGSGVDSSFSAAIVAPTVASMMSGDYSTQPIMKAAAEMINVTAPVTAKINVRTFTGEMAAGGLNLATAAGVVSNANMIVGVGDGVLHTTGTPLALAKDAVVVIKAKRSTLTGINLPTTTGALTTLYQTPIVQPATTNVYTYDQKSGTRAFFYGAIMANVPAASEATFKLAVNDYDMVQKVAYDPIGIGYCSAAFVDPNLVDVVIIDTANFPVATANGTTAEDNKWIWPATAPAAPATYPYMRTLYAQSAAVPTVGGSAAVMTALGVVLPAIQAGPLFRLSYFLP